MQPSDDLHRMSRMSREPDYGTCWMRAVDIWPNKSELTTELHRSKLTAPDLSCSWIVAFFLHQSYSLKLHSVLGWHHSRWVLETNQYLPVHGAPWGIEELSDPKQCTTVASGMLRATPGTKSDDGRAKRDINSPQVFYALEASSIPSGDPHACGSQKYIWDSPIHRRHLHLNLLQTYESTDPGCPPLRPAEHFHAAFEWASIILIKLDETTDKQRLWKHIIPLRYLFGIVLPVPNGKILTFDDCCAPAWGCRKTASRASSKALIVVSGKVWKVDPERAEWNRSFGIKLSDWIRPGGRSGTWRLTVMTCTLRGREGISDNDSQHPHIMESPRKKHLLLAFGGRDWI